MLLLIGLRQGWEELAVESLPVALFSDSLETLLRVDLILGRLLKSWVGLLEADLVEIFELYVLWIGFFVVVSAVALYTYVSSV